MFDQKLFDRLFARVIIDEITGCHIWQGQTDGRPDPYGRTTLYSTTIATHIAMWFAHTGQVPRGKKHHIDHRCTVRLCINFDHLQLRTVKKNMQLREKRKKHKGNVLACLAVKG